MYELACSNCSENMVRGHGEVQGFRKTQSLLHNTNLISVFWTSTKKLKLKCNFSSSMNRLHKLSECYTNSKCLSLISSKSQFRNAHKELLPFQQFNHIVILQTSKYFELPKVAYMSFLIFAKCDCENYGMLLQF